VFYLKIATIYAFLFAITSSVTLATSFNNPALAFFIPSVFSMMVYGKLKLGKANINVTRHALSCGLVFSVTTVCLCALLNGLYDWFKNPLLMYSMAFGGNFIFPFLLFPKINNARNV